MSLLQFPAMDINEVIRRCHLFAGVTDQDLELLVGVCRLLDCTRGQVLFGQGDEANGFYVVASGKVKIYKLSPDGKERILHIVQPGGSFAEAAIFADGCYPAFAECLGKCQLVFFPKRDFLDLLHSHSQIAINMIGGLSRFLRQFATQIEDLTFKDVPSRLARYLLDLGGDEQALVELPIAKSQLASNLGTVSETLSRTFRKLSDEAIIRVKGKQIEILDLERLLDLAESFKEG
ncbi:MAG: Crp/Fnr family transcriptional regulator [Desulfuromonadales bacterium]|nr:Crp/Fnr family transcriptional regulator [Desulfuromonadales bacterium]